MGKQGKAPAEATGIMLDVEYRQPKIRVIRSGLMIFFVLFSLIFIVPIVWMLLSAFKDTQEFLQVPPTLLPRQIDLGKLGLVWAKGGLGTSYLSTLIMVAGEVGVTLVCCGLAGYVLSRLKPRGSVAVLAVVLWSMMMPTNLSMVPLFMSFAKEIPILGRNMMDSYLPMWMMAGSNAFNTLLFKSFFDGIPKAYLEAARIDGCSEIGIFSKIIMPLSKPAFIAVSIFVVTYGWGAFLWPYLLIKEQSMQPLGVRVFTLQRDLPMDEYLMMLIFVVVPPILFFIAFQKYIMEGVSLGGVKG